MSSIVAVEYQKRDVIHLHSLDGGTRNFRRLTAMDLWYEMAGIARVYPYRHLNGKGAEGYVAKYIMKGRPWEIRGGGDLFLCGPFTHENDGEWFTDLDEPDDLIAAVTGVTESELSTVSSYVLDAVFLFVDESVALFCAICTDTVPSDVPLTTSKVYVVPLPAKLLATGVPPFAVPDTVMSPITKSDTDSENVTV